VFVNSMSDLFHRDVPMTFIAQVFAVMATAERHVFQVLTKRPQRMARLLGEWGFQFRNQMVHPEIGNGPPHASLPLPNVWLGTSIETDRYVFRADDLRATPAAVRSLSLEPLLGPVPSLDLTGIDWVIVGGESGPRSRPMEIAWAETIVERCRAAGVATFVKQLGSVAGGRTHHEIDGFPDSLRVREYPVAMSRPATVAGAAT
jgi:protein gp37